MNVQEYDILQALQLLKQGVRLQQAGAVTLFRYEDPRILVSSRGYTLRLRVDDFTELFAAEHFWIRQESEGLDEQKDAEYYAWRARSQ